MRCSLAIISSVIGTSLFEHAVGSARLAPDPFAANILPYRERVVNGRDENVRNRSASKEPTTIFWEKDGCKLSLTGVSSLTIDPKSPLYLQMNKHHPSECIDLGVVTASLKNREDMLVNHSQDSLECSGDDCEVRCHLENKHSYGSYHFNRKSTSYNNNPIRFVNSRVWDYFVTDNGTSFMSPGIRKLVSGICDYIAKQSVAVFRSLGIRNSLLSNFLATVKLVGGDRSPLSLRIKVPGQCETALTFDEGQLKGPMPNIYSSDFLTGRNYPLYDNQFTGYLMEQGGESLLRCVDLKFANEDIALADTPPLNILEIPNIEQRIGIGYTGEVKIQMSGRLMVPSTMDCLYSTGGVYASYSWYRGSTPAHMNPVGYQRSLSKKILSSLMKLAFKSAKEKYFANPLIVKGQIENDANLRRISRMYCNVLAHRHARVNKALQDLAPPTTKSQLFEQYD